MSPQRDDYLLNKLQGLEDKIDKLTLDRATRSDIDKLRDELKVIYVTRDSYEPRHAALIERDAQMEGAVRELRKDVEADLQKIHDRLESGKQQIQDQIKQQQERPWTRVQQLAGVAAVILVLIEFLIRYFHP